MRLVPLALWLPPAPGPLLPRVLAALAAATGDPAEPVDPLRWAITAVDAERGLRLEAVLITPVPPSA